MKLKALIAIENADGLHLPNAVFNASADEAKYLLEHGYAEAVEAAEAEAPAKKGGKKAAPADEEL